MKKSENLKKLVSTNAKLFSLGVSAFLLTLGSTAVATVAWFQSETTSFIQGMTLEFVSNGGLQIGYRDPRSGDIVYGTALDNTVLNEVDPLAYPLDPVLSAVSSAATEDYNRTLDPNNDYPRFRGAYSYRKTALPTFTNYGYLQFELFFKTDLPSYLLLAPSFAVTPCHEANAAKAKQINDAGGYDGVDVTAEDLDSIVDSIRVSFFCEDGYNILDPKKEEETPFGGALDLDHDGYFDMDVTKTELIYGLYEGEPIYSEPLEADEGQGKPHNCFFGAHKKGARAFLESQSIENGLSYAMENANSLDQMTLHENQGQLYPDSVPIAQLAERTDKRVVVTVYIEGWDKDAIDCIGEAQFNLNLGFTALQSIH